MIDSEAPSVLLGKIRSVLSAKWLMNDLEKKHFRSLIYKRNNKGPRLEPSGTSYLIVLPLYEISCMKTYCL